jgi:hypothetical protein
MGKKNDNTILVIGLAAAAAAVYYFYTKGSTAAAAPGSTSSLTNPGTGPVVYSSAPTPAASGTTATVVQGWFNTLDPANKQQAYAQYGNMTDAELTELADIIVNVWGVGGKSSADQTIFWNAWRVKYHILDGTYA